MTNLDREFWVETVLVSVHGQYVPHALEGPGLRITQSGARKRMHLGSNKQVAIQNISSNNWSIL